jgi:hypothetical protein
LIGHFESWKFLLSGNLKVGNAVSPEQLTVL